VPNVLVQAVRLAEYSRTYNLMVTNVPGPQIPLYFLGSPMKTAYPVVTLFNNNGVLKPQQGLAQVDRNAVMTATISLTGQTIESAREWISNNVLQLERRNGQPTVHLKIAPGGVAIVELKTQK